MTVTTTTSTTMVNGTSSSTPSSSSIPDSDWSKDRLMGKSVSFKGINNDGEAVTPATTTTTSTSSSATTRPSVTSKEKMNPMLWGRPGHLTEEEVETFVSSIVTK
jgi:hypothetical protein